MTRQPEPDLPPQETIVLRFAHGSACTTLSSSVVDYLLAPIFLKYVLLSVLIVAVLHERTGLLYLSGWPSVLLWILYTAALMINVFVLAVFYIFLKNKGITQSIYTPFLTMPSVIVTEFAGQSVLQLVGGIPFPATADFMEYIARFCIVLILFDVIYGTWVAPMHPNTVKAKPQTTPATLPKAPALTDKSPPPTTPQQDPVTEPVPEVVETILLGGQSVPTQSLVAITIGDHYLHVETTEKHIMLRGKMSDVIRNLDPNLGIQVNRSVWVARSKIRYAERGKDYSMKVVLPNFNTITVARSRWSQVQDTLKQWDIEIKRAA